MHGVYTPNLIQIHTKMSDQIGMPARTMPLDFSTDRPVPQLERTCLDPAYLAKQNTQPHPDLKFVFLECELIVRRANPMSDVNNYMEDCSNEREKSPPPLNPTPQQTHATP